MGTLNAKVREGLEAAAAIIVIVSPGSLKSQWVAYEVGYGTGTKKRILPFLTHQAIHPPGFLTDLTYVTTIDEVRKFFRANSDWATPSSTAAAPKTFSATLTDMQIQYLLTISAPRNDGMVHGSIDDRTGRDVASYQETLERFLGMGLVRPSGGGYKLTPKGWQLADQLWGFSILDALEV